MAVEILASLVNGNAIVLTQNDLNVRNNHILIRLYGQPTSNRVRSSERFTDLELNDLIYQAIIFCARIYLGEYDKIK